MGKHALVIDDSRAMRTIIGHILKTVGFQVTSAGDGKEGLKELREMERVDLVLVDWNFPEMDGLEFIRAVRKDKAYQDLPIIMVTTEIDSPLVEKAIDAGANEYVMKPFTKDVILEKLNLLGIETK